MSVTVYRAEGDKAVAVTAATKSDAVWFAMRLTPRLRKLLFVCVSCHLMFYRRYVGIAIPCPRCGGEAR